MFDCFAVLPKMHYFHQSSTAKSIYFVGDTRDKLLLLLASSIETNFKNKANYNNINKKMHIFMNKIGSTTPKWVTSTHSNKPKLWCYGLHIS